jgi:hypothetical protein
MSTPRLSSSLHAYLLQYTYRTHKTEIYDLPTNNTSVICTKNCTQNNKDLGVCVPRFLRQQLILMPHYCDNCVHHVHFAHTLHLIDSHHKQRLTAWTALVFVMKTFLWRKNEFYIISDFRRGVNEIFALLECHAAFNGSKSPAFRDNLSVVFQRVVLVCLVFEGMADSLSQKTENIKRILMHVSCLNVKMHRHTGQ